MPNFNQIVIAGHLGQDPKINALPDGTPVANFSVANTYKPTETTTWFECSVFGKRAEALSKYVKKGDAILVVGRFFNDSYTDGHGAIRSKNCIRVTDFSFLPKGETQSNQQPAPQPSTPQPDPKKDDLPF